MLARVRTSLLVLARTSVIVAGIRIAVAPTTVVIEAEQLTPLRGNGLGIDGCAMLVEYA
jgi:hypothetical protein